MSAKLFKDNDDELLKKLYSSRTNKELVQIFNGQYSAKQIKWRAKELKLRKDSETYTRALEQKQGAWEEWEKEIMKKHYFKDGLQYVADILSHRSITSIKGKAQRMHLVMDKAIRDFANGPKHHSQRAKDKIAQSNKGKTFSESHIENIRKNVRKGTEHPMYNPERKRKYDFGFTNVLKQKVYKRDNYTCALCNKKRRILAHHIDYTKENNVMENLISLCYSCHVKHHYYVPEEQKLKEKSLFESLARRVPQ